MNTHYAVLVFGGDFDNDHPDEELRGLGPSMMLIGTGPEDFCWKALAGWIEHHPLRRDELAEVVARDPVLVAQQVDALGAWGFHAPEQEGPDEGPQGPPPAASA